ncbi:SDR family NAD(P)-dependent oxidoreductase [Amycolatopsis balhimycina DSM 5908]|uniref:SDR family NAD(P)-dependent oxidoreductase n=1 Tax=Amycolatopsis balhimycina DSM 5908 TaxID=1081091 RepID=A0A428WVI1_AMYBA|nr:SDR family oxidoreductase [Amycolatopsis balhimycina]RSM47091.1 SDR family NAD(P)-dependent oxidoreductase [Amycolatopsis balhimycina DSM 5908]
MPELTRARLAGKVVLVTGAGQGVGRGTALALAREGACVALAGRTVAKCEAVAAEIDAFGGSSIALACDVTDRAQLEAVIAETAARFGGLDALVNNAQTSVQRLLAETTPEDVDVCWRSGPLATLHAMQAALPLLRVRGGSIVNFGSSTAIDGNVTFGAYAMAKEAIRGLSRVAAREWGRYGIRVNVVVPNALSPAAEQFSKDEPERFRKLTRTMPLGRMGDPETDIGRAVVALVSDDLAYLTGDTLMLTGGA